MTYPRIDPKTRRIIISDLTPPHKDKTTGVHGVGSGTIAKTSDITNMVFYEDTLVSHNDEVVNNE